MKKKSHDLVKEVRKNLKEHRKLHNAKVSANLDLFMYWTSLSLLALFNLIAVFFLIPFLMFFEGLYLYIAVGGFGLCFGFLFNLLILGIEHLEQKHSVIAGIFIPILAVADISLILKISEHLNSLVTRIASYSVSEIIIIFVGAFIAPYLFSVVTGKHKL